MAYVTFQEYADRHGISIHTLKNRARIGLLETAKCINGAQWIIDSNEPWVYHIKRGRGAKENADIVKRVRREARQK